MSFLVAVSSYPGSTGLVAGGTCVCSSGGTGNHGCFSCMPSFLPFLSPGCPVLLQCFGPVLAHLTPGVTVSSQALQVPRSDFTFLSVCLCGSRSPSLHPQRR